MNDADYDIAIIGGGLAGLCLAIQCAGAGFSAIVFEKETYPYHKVCGEYISMESYDFICRLGLDLSMMRLPIIRQLQLTDVKGKLYEFALPLGGFGISRFILDEALYRLAEKKGVHVLTATKAEDIRFEENKFTIITSKKRYTAKLAAGSFGKRSNMDIKWKRQGLVQKKDKLNNYIGVKYHIYYPFAKEKIALHNFNNGYCGISNIEDGKCCLCYLTTADSLQKAGNNIREMEKTILQKNPALNEIFSAASFIYKEPVTISQISFQKKKQIENHVLMIGDAAGMISPLCGNGMSMAMHGSKIAFENIRLYLQQKISRNKMEQLYISEWQKKFSKRLLIGRMVQRLFGGDAATSFFLNFMHHAPWLANKLIRSTHGKPF